MSDPFLTGLPEGGSGASEALRQEHSWAAARWTVNRHGYATGDVVLVNLDDETVREEIARTWLVILDETDQPIIRIDTDGNPQEA